MLFEVHSLASDATWFAFNVAHGVAYKLDGQWFAYNVADGVAYKLDEQHNVANGVAYKPDDGYGLVWHMPSFSALSSQFCPPTCLAILQMESHMKHNHPSSSWQTELEAKLRSSLNARSGLCWHFVVGHAQCYDKTHAQILEDAEHVACTDLGISLERSRKSNRGEPNTKIIHLKSMCEAKSFWWTRSCSNTQM